MSLRDSLLPPLLRDTPDVLGALLNPQTRSSEIESLVLCLLDFLPRDVDEYLFGCLCCAVRSRLSFFCSPRVLNRLFRLVVAFEAGLGLGLGSIGSVVGVGPDQGSRDGSMLLSKKPKMGKKQRRDLMGILCVGILRRCVVEFGGVPGEEEEGEMAGSVPEGPPEPSAGASPIPIVFRLEPGQAVVLLRLFVRILLAGGCVPGAGGGGGGRLAREFQDRIFCGRLLGLVLGQMQTQVQGQVGGRQWARIHLEEFLRFVFEEQHVRNCAGALLRLVETLIGLIREICPAGMAKFLDLLCGPRCFHRALVKINESFAYELLRFLAQSVPEMSSIGPEAVEALVGSEVRNLDSQFAPIVRILRLNPFFSGIAVRSILRGLLADWRVTRLDAPAAGVSKKNQKRMLGIRKIVAILDPDSPTFLARTMQEILLHEILIVPVGPTETPSAVADRRFAAFLDILRLVLLDPKLVTLDCRLLCKMLLLERTDFDLSSAKTSYVFHIVMLYGHCLLVWLARVLKKPKESNDSELAVRLSILSMQDELLMFCYNEAMQHPRLLDMLPVVLQTCPIPFPQLQDAARKWIYTGSLLSENILVCLFCFCQQQRLGKQDYLAYVELLLLRAGRLRRRGGSVEAMRFPQLRQMELFRMLSDLPRYALTHPQYHVRSIFWPSIRAMVLLGCIACEKMEFLLWQYPLLKDLFTLLIQGDLSSESLRLLMQSNRSRLSREQIRRNVVSFCEEMFRVTKDAFFDSTNESSWFDFFVACDLSSDRLDVPADFVSRLHELDSELCLAQMLRRCRRPNFLSRVLESRSPTIEEIARFSWLVPVIREDLEVVQNLPVDHLVRLSLTVDFGVRDRILFDAVLARLKELSGTGKQVLHGFVRGLVDHARRPKNLDIVFRELVQNLGKEKEVLRLASRMEYVFLRKLFAVESNIDFLRKVVETCINEELKTTECCLLIQENLNKLLLNLQREWIAAVETLVLRYYETPSSPSIPGEKVIPILLPSKSASFESHERVFLLVLRFVALFDSQKEAEFLSPAIRSFVHQMISLNLDLVHSSYSFVFDWFLDSNNQELALLSLTKVDLGSLLRNLCSFSITTEMKLGILRHPMFQQVDESRLLLALKKMSVVSRRLLTSFFVMNGLATHPVCLFLSEKFSMSSGVRGTPKSSVGPSPVSTELLDRLRAFQQDSIPAPAPPPILGSRSLSAPPRPSLLDDVLDCDPCLLSPRSRSLLVHLPRWGRPMLLSSMFNSCSERYLREFVVTDGSTERWILIDRFVARYYSTWKTDQLRSEVLSLEVFKRLLFSARDLESNRTASEILQRGFKIHGDSLGALLGGDLRSQLIPEVFQLAVYQLPWKLSRVIDTATFSVERPAVVMRSKFDGIVRKAVRILLEDPGEPGSPRFERWSFYFALLKQHCLSYPYVMVQYLESIVRGLLRRVNVGTTGDADLVNGGVLLVRYEFALDLLLCLRPAVFGRPRLLAVLLSQYYFDLLSKSFSKNSSFGRIFAKLVDLLVSAVSIPLPTAASGSASGKRKKPKKSVLGLGFGGLRSAVVSRRPLFIRLSKMYREFLAHKMLKRFYRAFQWDDDLVNLFPDEPMTGTDSFSGARRVPPPNHLLDSSGRQANAVAELGTNERVYGYLERIQHSLREMVDALPFLLDLLHVANNHHVRNVAYALLFRVLRRNVSDSDLGKTVVERILQLLQHPSEEVRRHAVVVSFQVSPYCAEEQLYELLRSLFRLAEGNATALVEAKKIVSVLLGVM